LLSAKHYIMVESRKMLITGSEMKLFCTLTSPYSRKVRIAALEKGVMNQVEVVIAPPAENSADLHAANPLGKVPALITDDGLAIYDSPVICEYLDGLSDLNKLYPAAGGARRWDDGFRRGMVL
jgi:glutathione S-transferase